jgi:hypothetical protein
VDRLIFLVSEILSERKVNRGIKRRLQSSSEFEIVKHCKTIYVLNLY